MPTPVVHPFPVKRPGFMLSASWIGSDDDLVLQVTFPDLAGVPRALAFTTRAPGSPGEVCVPTSTNLNDLGLRARDILVAHTRMACMIAGVAIPGSKEFYDAFIQITTNLQTAIGTVSVTAVTIVSDQNVDITYKKGNGPSYVVRVDHGEINKYIFVPETQLLVIPGAIEKQFPTYDHDYPSKVLTANQKTDIVNYVMTLEPWV